MNLHLNPTGYPPGQSLFTRPETMVPRRGHRADLIAKALLTSPRSPTLLKQMTCACAREGRNLSTSPVRWAHLCIISNAAFFCHYQTGLQAFHAPPTQPHFHNTPSQLCPPDFAMRIFGFSSWPPCAHCPPFLGSLITSNVHRLPFFESPPGKIHSTRLHVDHQRLGA